MFFDLNYPQSLSQAVFIFCLNYLIAVLCNPAALHEPFTSFPSVVLQSGCKHTDQHTSDLSSGLFISPSQFFHRGLMFHPSVCLHPAHPSAPSPQNTLSVVAYQITHSNSFCMITYLLLLFSAAFCQCLYIQSLNLFRVYMYVSYQILNPAFGTQGGGLTQ